MGSHEVSPRNRAERRSAERRARRARAAGAALTAGSAALAMGAGWIAPGMQSAGAATTLHVTSTADSGTGSLRDVVASASSGDTITFDVTGTITLTSGEIAFNNKNLTFSGPGASALTISGNDASQIFAVANSNVTISGLTLAHASHPSSNGGAIETDGDLTLTNDVFDHNVSGDDGGALVVGGALTVTNSTFTNNSANDWGGAIFAHDGHAPVDITGSTFTGNSAGHAGGAIAIQEHSGVTIDSTTVSGNTALHGGGIELFYNGAQSISASTISGNHATKGRGGGIDLYNSAGLSISSSTVSGNASSDDGGGLSLYEVSGNISLDGTTISGSTSQSSGGGAFVKYVDGSFSMSGSSVSSNTTDGWGGGLYFGGVTSGITVSTSAIADNTASSGGGGVQIWGDHLDANVSVVDSTISGNSAHNGGGGWIQWSVAGSTTFANSTVSGNTSHEEGGGLYFYNSASVKLEMTTITGNTATGTTGGVYLSQQETLAAASTRGHHETQPRAEATGGGGDGDKSHTHQAHSAAGPRAAAPPSVTVTGTILWGNSGNDLGDVGAATITRSLLGTVAAGIQQTGGGGNLTGVNPLLGPLQNNGGPTETHALLTGSPAKDAGPDPVPTFPNNEFDQRGAGFARVVDGRSDIGAFEVQPPPAPSADAVVITPKFTG